MKKLSDLEMREYNKYTKKYGQLKRCKIDELNDHLSNGDAHELAKYKLWRELRKQGHKVLTEAVEHATGIRRDLVDLTSGEVYEFETPSRRAGRHGKGINVRMVEE